MIRSCFGVFVLGLLRCSSFSISGLNFKRSDTSTLKIRFPPERRERTCVWFWNRIRPHQTVNQNQKSY
uniref:Putative secreted protein n=1 Tax=Anopheles darlingi TaxID=43151 RepID=A0A2M4D592_ANODA